jgi:hypothetical protein
LVKALCQSKTERSHQLSCKVAANACEQENLNGFPTTKEPSITGLSFNLNVNCLMTYFFNFIAKGEFDFL